MATQLKLGAVTLDVVRKDIKNVHLSVYPPTGRVRISVPLHMSMDAVRVFAVAKLGWIKKQQGKIQGQEREPPREFLDRESHYVWGRRYLLKIEPGAKSASVELSHQMLLLRVRGQVDRKRKESILDGWYRAQVREAAQPMVSHWQQMMGVTLNRLHVQRMRTKWGSCNPESRSIRLNSELAKKPLECLEYIVVHELAHLLEPTHGSRFVALMDRFMPHWQVYRDALNRIPVRHEDWGY